MAKTIPAPATKAPEKMSAVKAKKAGPSVGDLLGTTTYFVLQMFVLQTTMPNISVF